MREVFINLAYIVYACRLYSTIFVGLFVFVPVLFLSFRVTGTYPVTTDELM